ncbi:hypothetical protein NUM3379_17960 [Kineococcus sp. NUM-3379]
MSAGLGEVSRLARTALAWRLGAVVLLLVAALVVRGSGVLRPEASGLPPLPGAAEVFPGLVRAGEPQEADLVRLVQDNGFSAVVDVEPGGPVLADVEEEAVATGLGITYLRLPVAADGMPSAAQLQAVADLLDVVRPTESRPVLLHDENGAGPVLVLSAQLQLLRGAPPEVALETLGAGGSEPTAEQVGALREVASVVEGRAGRVS